MLLTKEQAVEAYGRIPESGVLSTSPTDHAKDCLDVAIAQRNEDVAAVVRLVDEETARPATGNSADSGFIAGLHAAIGRLRGER